MKYFYIILFSTIIFLPEKVFSNEYELVAGEQENIFIIKEKKDQFRVYDATAYLNKPSFTDLNFKYIQVLWVGYFWEQGELKDIPNLKKVKKFAETLNASELPYIIDIEHWSIEEKYAGSAEEADRNLDKYIAIIETLKSTRPDLKFAYYGVIPNFDYYGAVTEEEFLILSKRMWKLVPYVDAIFPTLYTFSDNIDKWKVYAKDTLVRASIFKKPVYPFIWPRYHQGSREELRGQEIPQEFWKTQLEVCSEFSNGAVIWDSLKTEWNKNAGWWIETEKYLK